MLGLAFRSDGSAVDAAIGELVEELTELATTPSGDRDLVHRRQGGMPNQRRQQKHKQHSLAASVQRQRDERIQAAANRLVAYVAAAGRAAGFEVTRGQ